MTPPFAVPSSFVSTRPVTFATSVKSSACEIAFCPVFESSTSSASCGASGSSRDRMRWIFPSSSINGFFVWSRPAVSMIATSALRAMAAFTVSNATAAGSLPCFAATTSQPTRSPQTWSCSIAAARKVSPAPSTTFLPARA